LLQTLNLNRPSDEGALLKRCKAIEGWTFEQLATALNLKIPLDPLQRKGWIGQAAEWILGATAGTQALPDFFELGIELKTIPIHASGKPAESTFVTSISLLTLHQETWETSPCFAKLKRVLWLPIEGDSEIPFPFRRIGRAMLWSPTPEQEKILKEDWEELTGLMVTGRLSEIHAGLGRYLQVRPKAANGKALCFGFDEKGHKVKTLPRGFYLRSGFTANLLPRRGEGA
jgi:DNA mismatch repair protein MutH